MTIFNSVDQQLTAAGQRKRAVTLAVLSALALSACGGGGSGGSGSSGGGSGSGSNGGSGGGSGGIPPPAAPVVTRFAYVVNSSDNNISTYAVNSATGALTFKGNAATGRFPKTVVLDPKQKFAYVTNQGTADISIYAVNANTGMLTEIAGSPMGVTVGDSGYVPIVIDPTGRFAYVGAITSNSVVAYAIDAVTGALAFIQRVVGPLNAAVSLAIEKTGQYLYAAQRRSGAVTVYQVNATTGFLTDVGFVTTGGFTKDPSCIAVDPSGQYALVTNQTVSTLLSFNISASSGLLTQQSGSPIATGVSPTFVAIHPGGQFALVSDFGGTDIRTFAVGSSASASTSAITLADNPFGVGIEPAGQFAYSYGNSNKVFVFSVNQATGALTAISNVPTGRLPSSIAFFKGVVPKQFAYVPNAGLNSVSLYTIDATTGALSGSGIADAVAGDYTYTVAVVPNGKFVYAVNQGTGANAGSVSMYSASPINGALTAIAPGTVAAGGRAYAIAVDPQGRFAYVANSLDNTLGMYSINSVSGLLTPVAAGGGVIATGASPRAVSVHPNGLFVYVANLSSNSLSTYSIDQTTGALTAVGAAVPSLTQPFAIAVDFAGKFAYATNYGSNTVSVYTINAATGVLTAVAGSPSAGGTQAWSIALEPTGKFAYVVNTGSDDLWVYSIAANGLLAQVGAPVATGVNPRSIVIDPTGQFVYLANSGSGNLSAYKINPVNGTLAPVTGSPLLGVRPIAIAVTAGAV